LEQFCGENIHVMEFLSQPATRTDGSSSRKGHGRWDIALYSAQFSASADLPLWPPFLPEWHEPSGPLHIILRRSERFSRRWFLSPINPITILWDEVMINGERFSGPNLSRNRRNEQLPYCS
jgi:hypothetical protein